MKLFESAYKNKFSFFERYYDTELKKSVKSEITLPYEWYEPSSRGLYKFILDEDITLDKKQGNAKEGRDSYGFLDPIYRNIRDNYWNKNAYNSSPRIWYLDIETRSKNGFPLPEKADQQITLMQFFDSKENKMFALGLKDWKHQSDYEFPYEIEYINCKDEVQLLKTYISFFKKLDPLIIYAWNGAGFDFPFIYNRIKNLGMNVNDLSNYGNVSYSEAVQDGKIEFNFNADGHFYTDLMIVYKKFVLDPRPSYSLDTIAEIELKENKVQHTEYASFDDFYTGKYIVPNNPTDEQKSSKIYNAAINSLNEEVKELAHSDFVYYGVKDTYLIKKIDDSKNLTVLMNMIAEKMGVQISDAMGTVKPWSQYIMNKSMLNKRVMPPRSDNSQPSVVGGYVRDPVKGRHKWILSGDVNSMYPLLGMVGFNMSPETFVPKYKLPSDLRDLILSYFNDQDEGARLELDQNIFGAVTELIKKYNYSLGINGAVFSKDKLGMIPEMVQEIYDDRKKSKKIMFDYEKRKVLIGSILNERKQ